MTRKYRKWPREEYDRLEELVKAGWRYADIAADLGRGIIEVQGGAQRIGLMSSERKGWRRIDWDDIDRAIIDCLEAQLMTIPQVAAHLTAIGKPVSYQSVYRRVSGMPHWIRERARANGAARRSAVAARMRRRQQLKHKEAA